MRLIIIALLPLAIISCRSSKVDVQQQKNWNNPEIFCDVPSITESINQEIGEAEINGNSSLAHFCRRMNDRFSTSNISVSEANKVYELLVLSGLTLDEQLGMPDPNLSQIKDNSISIFSNKIAILKIDDTTFEIFFKKTGCGVTFIWGRFEWPIQPENLSIITLESWRASFPC
jgi:hypothetical protein